MNDTVITKQIDDLGRIVLPKEIRKRVGIQIRSDVEVRVEGEKIVLTKAQNECIFCGLHKDLKEFKGKCICPSCLKGIEELENK
ncbi:MAG: AbrB/MazE/SpoVT family DNA-binding domain-containing protein [Oscillospiraceae bacterium]